MAGYVPKSFVPDAPPSKYVPKSFEPEAAEEPSAWEAAGHAAAQGATFRFGDEAGGVIQALGDKIMGSEKPFGELYARNRDTFRREDKQAEEAHPYVYGATEALAGLPAAIATGGGAGAGAARLFATGAAQGAVQRLGGSEATDLKGLAADTLEGGAEGLVGAGIGLGLGKVAQGAGRLARGIAENRALKAAGAVQKDVSRLRDTGKLKDVAGFILDQKLLPPLGIGGPEAVAARAGKKATEAGGRIGQTLRELDAVAPEAVNPGAVADLAEVQVVKPLKNQLGMGDTTSKAQALIDEMRTMRPGLDADEIGAARRGMSFTEAENRLKRPLDNFVNWSREQSPALEGVKQVRGQINGAIEQAAETADPALAARFKGAKGDYGLAQEVLRLSDEAAARDLGNRMMSPTDLGMGIAGAAAMGTGGGAGLAVANHLGRKYGSATAAQTSNALSKFLRAGDTAAVLEALGISGGRNFDRFRNLVRRE